MNFSQAVQSGLKRYADFSGVATRSEYWYFALFVVLGKVVTNYLGTTLSTLFTLATLVPTIAVGVRRMHDRNLSGWFLLVPIFNLVQTLLPSETNSRWTTGKPVSGSSQSWCPNGHVVRPGDVYCRTCGIPVTQSCPNGHPVGSSDRFCQTCGSAIAQ